MDLGEVDSIQPDNKEALKETLRKLQAEEEEQVCVVGRVRRHGVDRRDSGTINPQFQCSEVNKPPEALSVADLSSRAAYSVSNYIHLGRRIVPQDIHELLSLNKQSRDIALRFILGWPISFKDRLARATGVTPVTTQSTGWELAKSNCIKALVVKEMLDHDYILDCYDKEDKFCPPPIFSFEHFSLLLSTKKVKSKIKLARRRRDSLDFVLSVMLASVSLHGLKLASRAACHPDFACLLGGYQPSRRRLADHMEFCSPRDKFPITSVFNRRVAKAILLGYGSRLGTYHEVPAFIFNDAVLWRDNREAVSPNLIVMGVGELTGPPETQRTTLDEEPCYHKYPLFRKAGSNDTDEEEYADPIHIFNNQATLGQYTNTVTNNKFDEFLDNIFSTKISRVLQETDFGDSAKVSHISLPIDMRDGQEADNLHTHQPTGETRAWYIKSAFSRGFTEEILEYVNTAPFLSSSDSVGARGSNKKRFYRCAQGESGQGGVFHLSNDDALIQYDGMLPIEKKLSDFVVELMRGQDEIVGDTLPEGVYQCEWVPEKTMCQVTASTISGSAYMFHSDKGFHHSQDIYSVDQSIDEGGNRSGQQQTGHQL